MEDEPSFAVLMKRIVDRYGKKIAVHTQDFIINKLSLELQELATKRCGRLRWSVEEKRLSLTLKDHNGRTLLQQAISTGKLFVIQSVLKTRKLADEICIETLNTGGNLNLKRRAYRSLLDDLKNCLQHFDDRSCTSAIPNRSLESVLENMQKINVLFVNSKQSNCQEVVSLFRGVEEVLQFFDWEFHHGDAAKDSEQAHVSSDCLFCKIFYVNRKILDVLLAHCEDALKKSYKYLRAFHVFDAVKWKKGTASLQTHWMDGIEVLKSQNLQLTILEVAIIRGNLPAVVWLLDRAAFNIAEIKGVKPNHITLATLSSDAEFILREIFHRLSIQNWQPLLEHKQTCIHNTSLHYAAQKGNENACIVLCEHGACYDVENLKNQTPGHFAGLSGNSDVVNFFGQLKSLFMAAERGDKDCYEAILTCTQKYSNAKIHARNIRGLTACRILEEVLQTKNLRKASLSRMSDP